MVEGRAIRLSPQKAVILGMLLKQFGKPVHKDRIIFAIWQDDEPEDAKKVLEVQMCGIRKLIAGTRLQISGHYGFGYSITLQAGRG